jgi:hypothetical protein
MKNNGNTTILNWALGLCMVVLAVGAIQYFFKTREVRTLQTQMLVYQNKQQLLNSIIAECLEYSKRNPSIDPILEANNLKAKSAAAAPSKPATK